MSRGCLLDTNVPSELTRSQPDRRVAQWIEDTDDDLMHISVITIGEVCKRYHGSSRGAPPRVAA